MQADDIRWNATGPELLTIGDVARLLSVHPNSVRRWANQGRLRVYRVGIRGDRRFNPEDVASFLESWGSDRLKNLNFFIIPNKIIPSNLD